MVEAKEQTPEDTIRGFYSALTAKDVDRAYSYCDKASTSKAGIVNLVKEMETVDKVQFRNIKVRYISQEAERAIVEVEYDLQMTFKGETE